MEKKRDRRGQLQDPPVSRRQALAKLGLGFAAAYAAPALLTLSDANAKGESEKDRERDDRGNRKDGADDPK